MSQSQSHPDAEQKKTQQKPRRTTRRAANQHVQIAVRAPRVQNDCDVIENFRNLVHARVLHMHTTTNVRPCVAHQRRPLDAPRLLQAREPATAATGTACVVVPFCVCCVCVCCHGNRCAGATSPTASQRRNCTIGNCPRAQRQVAKCALIFAIIILISDVTRTRAPVRPTFD